MKDLIREYIKAYKANQEKIYKLEDALRDINSENALFGLQTSELEDSIYALLQFLIGEDLWDWIQWYIEHDIHVVSDSFDEIYLNSFDEFWAFAAENKTTQDILNAR